MQVLKGVRTSDAAAARRHYANRAVEPPFSLRRKYKLFCIAQLLLWANPGGQFGVHQFRHAVKVGACVLRVCHNAAFYACSGHSPLEHHRLCQRRKAHLTCFQHNGPQRLSLLVLLFQRRIQFHLRKV